MNTHQKVVLLIGTLSLVFVLLFMDGMNYDGIGLAAAVWLFAMGMGIYWLRDRKS